jgi:ribosomal protein L11 methyltransferase
MPWLQFILETTEEQAETCSEFLLEAGAEAVTFEDAKDNPLFEPAPNTTPLWHDTRVIGLFDANIDIEAIKTQLQQDLDPAIFASLKIDPLEDQDWVRTTLNNFQPMQFGEHLWVVPSSSEFSKKSSKDIELILDPGLAFGTGTHPTTRLCLEWLDKNNVKDYLVLDYGCGSGILGIAALKLGANKVLAVDYDPQALQSTVNNSEKNGLTKQEIQTLLPYELLDTLQVDLILANILANPIIELAEKFATHLKKRGQIILSGILNSQADSVVERYKLWFSNFEIVQNEDWVLISAERK